MGEFETGSGAPDITDIKELEIQPLTKAGFAAFGTVIETDGAKEIVINQGTTTRFDAMSAVDVAAEDGKPIISLFRGRRRPDPIEIHLMERHPLGSQAFMPLSQHEWLVVVAHGNTADDGPDFSTLACFRARGDQGVSYDRGTWHHPLLVLQPEQDFLVIDRQGGGHNLDEVWHDGLAAIIRI
jgi:ureidoglycolate lyase